MSTLAVSTYLVFQLLFQLSLFFSNYWGLSNDWCLCFMCTKYLSFIIGDSHEQFAICLSCCWFSNKGHRWKGRHVLIAPSFPVLVWLKLGGKLTDSRLLFPVSLIRCCAKNQQTTLLCFIFDLFLAVLLDWLLW